MTSDANPLITRLELEQTAAQLRSQKLVAIGKTVKDYASINACVEMAFAEQQTVKLIQDVIKFLKRNSQVQD